MSETPDPGPQSSENSDGTEAPLDFDPYRFGAPEHPVPPEYAPPGYQPPPWQLPPPPVLPPPPDPSAAYPPPGYGPQPGAYPPAGQPGYPGYPPPGYQGYPPGPGYPPMPPNYNAQYPAPRTGNGRATAGLVLGVASILLCWTIVFDIVFIVLGVIFSSLGRSAAQRDPRVGGKGVATAGLVCSAVGLVLAVVFTVVVVRAANHCNAYPSDSSEFRDCVQHYLHLK